MSDKDIVSDLVRMFGHGRKALSSGTLATHAELTSELQKYVHTLGPTPKRCLEALSDLGLTDAEIGRYFRIPDNVVTQLRELWKIKGTV
ncbi:hypothetical protein C7964_104153 [Loktanella sp. PT4BL]|jgi:hypothetical protein|uniref:hypothetical protein n=1 Tax=Loktanella sp. PT4BL TaxID=2135611 RepID=UPI000D7557CB|nr:hypothetical protein [Loktanella sp. PT4BL]PXW68063.1 hypothetical protein C7964_104153 [Loktanella sp. PT4BL]